MNSIYTVSALSQLLGISERTIRKELKQGNIKGIKKLGRWFVLHSNLVDWLNGSE